MGDDDQHRLGIDRCLRVVALLEASTRDGHDARVLVREADMVAVARVFLGRLGVLDAGLLARIALGLAALELGLLLLLLGFLLIAGWLLDMGYRPLDCLLAL